MTTNEIPTGTTVIVTKGRHAGCRGTVWCETASQVGIDFDTPSKGDSNATVRKSNVRIAS